MMQAIARWGNFFNQELYGPPTTLPWGIPIDCAHRIAGPTPSTRVRSCPRRPAFHPLFLYESLSGALGAIVLIWLGFHARKRLRPGDLLLVFFIWYGAVRFTLEAFRERQLDVLRRPDRAVVSALFILAALVILFWRHRSGAPLDDPATSRRTRRGAPSGGRSTPTSSTTMTTTIDDDDSTTTDDEDADEDDGDEDDDATPTNPTRNPTTTAATSSAPTAWRTTTSTTTATRPRTIRPRTGRSPPATNEGPGSAVT